MKFALKILVSIIIMISIMCFLSLYYLVNSTVINYDEHIDYESNNTSTICGITFPRNISEIDLSNIEIRSSILYDLYEFPRLKKVTFRNQTLTSRIQHVLERVYPNIEFDWNVKILDKTVNSSVEKLDFSNYKIEDLDSFKSELALLHNLKYLDMSDCNLSNEELAKLREEFPNVKIVWKLYLGVWSLKTDDVAFSVLITTFNYKRMKSSDIEVLKYCTDLQALDLGHQSITDISVIGDYLPNLRILILADNKISDITPISKLKHLHYLELFMNKVKDISPLTSCKEMVDLNLAHIPTLYDFSPLINNNFPLLERLCMQNSGGTYKYYSSIKKKYPNVKIVHTGYGSTHSGWRTHPRYYAMIDMYHKKNYISDLFSKYDNLTSSPNKSN